jgi:hypothetical protein
VQCANTLHEVVNTFEAQTRLAVDSRLDDGRCRSPLFRPRVRVDFKWDGGEQSGQMPAFLLFVIRFVRLLLTGHQAVAIENAALRLQLAAFQRKQRKRPVVTTLDRVFWITLRRLVSPGPAHLPHKALQVSAAPLPSRRAYRGGPKPLRIALAHGSPDFHSRDLRLLVSL